MDEDMSVLENGFVDIVDGAIARVGFTDDLRGERFEGETLDARGALVLPGFINGHCHAGMSLLRGAGDDMPLREWLETRIFPLERQFAGREFIALGARLAAAELLKGGVTTLNDMYYDMAEAARVYDEVGIRCVAGGEVSTPQGFGSAARMRDDLERFLAAIDGMERIVPAITPHSIYTLTEEQWGAVIDFAAEKKLFVHTHLSETHQENVQCKERYGKSPTRVLEEWGLWELPCLVAHAVHVNDEDIDVLSRFRVGVSHNPESNLKLGSGIAPVVDMRARGIAVAFGTDSTASNNDLDLLAEAAIGAKLQAFVSGPGSLSARDAVRMLTIEGARALRLDDRVGSLEPGKRGDVIVLDVRRPHAVPQYDPYSHLVYAARSADVRHTLVDGSVLVRDGKLTTIDEAALVEETVAFGARIRSALA
jgi:5-methylthioadenosine/S-adenosylhomocysteine deaminase